MAKRIYRKLGEQLNQLQEIPQPTDEEKKRKLEKIVKEIDPRLIGTAKTYPRLKTCSFTIEGFILILGELKINADDFPMIQEHYKEEDITVTWRYDRTKGDGDITFKW